MNKRSWKMYVITSNKRNSWSYLIWSPPRLWHPFQVRRDRAVRRSRQIGKLMVVVLFGLKYSNVTLYYVRIRGIKGWYWPQGLLSMPTNNSHKSWGTSSDKTSVSSTSKSDFFTSSIVIPGQCNYSCSRVERRKASPRRLKTETFG